MVDQAEELKQRLRKAELAERMKAKPEESNVGGGTFRTIDDLVRSIAGGMTFGYADEIAAKMRQITEGGKYEDLLKEEKARDKATSPYVRIPGEITGAVASTVAAAPIAAAAAPAGMAQAAAKVPGWIKALGYGGLFGGLYGSGEAEPGERIEGAATGAAIGAPLAGVSYPVMRGIGAGARGIRDILQSRLNPSVAADRKILQALARDETTPGRVAGRLRQLGPQGTITDAGGENVMGLARAAAAAPGSARNRAMQVYEGRAEGEAKRIAAKVGKLLDPDDFYAAEEAYLGNLRTRAQPYYQRAYEQHQSVMTPALNRVLNSRTGQKALRETSQIVADERAAGAAKYLGAVDDELLQAMRAARDVGNLPAGTESLRPGPIKGFSLETWDQIKRGFDSLLDSKAYRNELTGKLNKRGYAVDQMRRTVLKELDKATGGPGSDYAVARSIYAGDAEVIGALREGRKALTMDPELIRRNMAAMSEAAAEAYRTGAARALKDIVDKTVDTGSAARKLFGNQRMRDRFRAIFPDQKSFNEFAQTMVAEKRFDKVYRFLNVGSPTQPRQAERADLLSDIASSASAAAGSNLPGGHGLVMSGIGRKIGQAVFGPGEAMDKAIAQKLMSRNQPANQFLLDQLRRQELDRALAQYRAGLLERGLTAGAIQQTRK